MKKWIVVLVLVLLLPVIVYFVFPGLLYKSVVILGRKSVGVAEKSVAVADHTISYFEADLGIVKSNLRPGRGLIIDNIKSMLFTAPVVLHYIRYFIF